MNVVRMVLVACWLVATEGALTAQTPLKVLFIGNSQMQCYDLPQMIKIMSESAPADRPRIAIGRALMSRPKLLMLDEPSLGLSPLLTQEIFNIIRDINEKDGVTILLVEQNVNMALRYANFAFLMENGRIVRADKPEILREDEDVKEFYLGIAKETSVKGYKRYRRKVRFR